MTYELWHTEHDRKIRYGPFFCSEIDLMAIPPHYREWPEPYVTDSFNACMEPMMAKFMRKL